MRVLVCGSRYFNDKELMEDVLKQYPITEIIHGGARGADTLSGDYGRESNVPVRVWPADWNTHGRRAGPIRNHQMLEEGKPDLVVTFLAPNSKGTKHMIEIAEKAGVKVVVVNI